MLLEKSIYAFWKKVVSSQEKGRELSIAIVGVLCVKGRLQF